MQKKTNIKKIVYEVKWEELVTGKHNIMKQELVLLKYKVYC